MRPAALLLAFLACTADTLALRLPAFTIGSLIIDLNAYDPTTTNAYGPTTTSRASISIETTTSSSKSTPRSSLVTRSTTQGKTLLSSSSHKSTSTYTVSSTIRSIPASLPVSVGQSVSVKPASSSSSASISLTLSTGQSASVKPATSSVALSIVPNSNVAQSASGRPAPSSSQISRGTAASSSRPVLPSGSVQLSNLACDTTIYSTITTTVIPVVTLVTYINQQGFINGDDFGPLSTTPAFTTITNDYTTIVSLTTTTTTTVLPASLINSTATITEYPPATFVPIQDSLPGAGYDGKFDGPFPAGKNKQRRAPSAGSALSRPTYASSCLLTTQTLTSTLTLPTRVSYITNSNTVEPIIYPAEGFTLYEPGTGIASTITKVVGEPTTIYAATVSTTYTISEPTATSTIYAACSPSNYADYITQPNGTVNPINFIFLNNVLDYNFRISQTPYTISTAYQCCTWALGIQAAVWILYENNFCVASWALNGPATCQDQSVDTQFQASYAYNRSRVIGNGYCGQVSSSYFDAERDF